MKRKKAFTIIEVILTIIVLSLAFTTVPSIVHNVVVSSQFLRSSVGMHAGLSKVQIVRGKLWDANNGADVSATGYYGILTVEEPSKEYIHGRERPEVLACNSNPKGENYGMREGNFKGDGRRKCSMALKASKFKDFGSNKDGTFQDIDDYDKDKDEVIDGGRYFIVETKVDYIKYSASGDSNLHMKLNSTNTNLQDASVVLGDTEKSTDIKRIIVDVYKGDSAKKKQERITRYVYYATNIGLTKPLIKKNE